MACKRGRGLGWLVATDGLQASQRFRVAGGYGSLCSCVAMAKNNNELTNTTIAQEALQPIRVHHANRERLDTPQRNGVREGGMRVRK